ncbi:PAS domain S-box protein, partial [Aliarcobacter skirrowii]
MSKEIILDDYAFLVSETNEKGNIIFANDDFCEIAGFTVDELIGKPHNIVRHKDMP